MKRLLFIFLVLTNIAGADILKDNLQILNDFSHNLVEIEKLANAVSRLTSISAVSSTSSNYSDKQIYELLDMLKLVVKSLAVLSAILILFLLYFIYDNFKFKNTTLKELEKAREKLADSSIKDQLTGLCNKKYFEEVFNIEASISIREKTHLNFFILEINNIDGFSQTELEDILTKVSNLLKLHFKRATDSIFRLKNGIFGGIIVSRKEDEVKLYLEKFIKDIEESKCQVTVSVGLKTNHIDEKLSKETIYNMALHSLSVSKEKGPNTIVEFDETLRR